MSHILHEINVLPLFLPVALCDIYRLNKGLCFFSCCVLFLCSLVPFGVFPDTIHEIYLMRPQVLAQPLFVPPPFVILNVCLIF